ncbi:MAG: hypothetical protein IJP44_09040 [Bacteroidales bacterium]|nr:hypothetical protein [Bacteroidales bacterium]
MMKLEKNVILRCERTNHKTMRTINITQFRASETAGAKKAKSYPKAPKGCISLEEFSDKLEEAILKKL